MLTSAGKLDSVEVERALRAVRELMAEAYRDKGRMNGGEILDALRIANAALKFW